MPIYVTYVRNPVTGRLIVKGGATYKKVFNKKVLHQRKRTKSRTKKKKTRTQSRSRVRVQKAQPRRRRARPRDRGPKFKKLKFNRPSPALSATLYRGGTIRTGNDGRLYKVNVGKGGIHRWVRA